MIGWLKCPDCAGTGKIQKHALSGSRYKTCHRGMHKGHPYYGNQYEDGTDGRAPGAPMTRTSSPKDRR